MNKIYKIDDLKEIMSSLRNPDGGCPWDLKQNFATIAPYTIEEAYEVVDAIEGGDLNELKDELGDLLFQVIFHSHLASEELVADEQGFTFDDVVHGLCEKLVRRHPHVFGDEKLLSDAEIKAMWERVKAEERQVKSGVKKNVGSSKAGLLNDIPVGLPGLSRAVKLQKRAATIGFDWPSIGPVIEKIEEELGELKEALGDGVSAGDNNGAYNAEQKRHIEEEFGDLLFVMANLGRHLSIDPEKAVRGGNQKFERRFSFIEQELRNIGRSLEEATLEEMDHLWDQAKLLEKE